MIGKTISHYKILERLGGGGMGVVYKALDTKLDRYVALKFLPPYLAHDDEEKKRFAREAKAASALDHPNICTVYETGETEDGRAFIAMAYYQGETLKYKIKNKKLSIDEITDIVIQISRGLKKAHDNKIIHRDIKPANIMITDTDEVKIVDFGLAKVQDQTMLTQSNSTMGTVSYMSPEQLDDSKVDQRTDIWSLGVVLYEMLTGEKPFTGDYDQAVMYSILNNDPKPLRKFKSRSLNDFQQIINKALVKEIEIRYKNLDELVNDLHLLSTGSAPKIQPAKKSKKQKKKIWKKVKIAFTIFVFVAGMSWIGTKYSSKPRFSTAEFKQLTFNGNTYISSISPDGSSIAYIDSRTLLVRNINDTHPVEIFKPEVNSLWFPYWSSNGSEIFFQVQTDTFSGTIVTSPFGGEYEKVSTIPMFCQSKDGSKYAGGWPAEKRIYFLNKITGDTTSIKLSGNFNWILTVDWSHVNDHLLFLTKSNEENAVWTIKPDGGSQQKVIADSEQIISPVWARSKDAIYYLKSSGATKNLEKLRIDPSSGSALGKSIKLQSGLHAGDNISIDNSDTKIIFPEIKKSSNLKLFQKKENEYTVNDLTTGTAQIFSPSISPDGEKVVYAKGNKETANIFIIDIETETSKQLTSLNSYCSSPAWSPDGKEIAFGSNEGGACHVWRINRAGGKPVKFKKTQLSEDDLGVIWAPNKNILYHTPGNKNYRILDPLTEKERKLVHNDQEGWMFTPSFSPDNKEVAIDWNREERPGVWIVSLLDSSQTYLSPNISAPVKWSADGKWLYAFDYPKTDRIVKINIETGKIEPHYNLSLWAGKVDMTSDEQIIIAEGINQQSDIWMMENFDPQVN